MVKKRFVIFYSPGTFVAEESTKEIDSWDVAKAISWTKEIIERHGAKPYAFQFVTRGREDDEFDSHIIATSGMYYINGVIKTLDQIKAENNTDNRILISNMELNGWDHVVITYSPYRWVQPFRENDAVVNI